VPQVVELSPCSPADAGDKLGWEKVCNRRHPQLNGPPPLLVEWVMSVLWHLGGGCTDGASAAWTPTIWWLPVKAVSGASHATALDTGRETVGIAKRPPKPPLRSTLVCLLPLLRLALVCLLSVQGAAL
jgi:hypothetical protein